jgi:hypothetical protein
VLLEKFIPEFVCIAGSMKSKVLHFDKENDLSRMEIFTSCWKIFPSDFPEEHGTNLSTNCGVVKKKIQE